MEILHSYTNGNIKVELFSDGTKTYEYDGNPEPEYPTSMDIKITNYCDNAMNCLYCHEKSNQKGVHSNIYKLLDVLKGLPAGTENAIGGGSTLSHPDVIEFLTELKHRGTIANITINQVHVKPHASILKKILDNDLAKGIGLSYTSKYRSQLCEFSNISDNLVYHLIAGVNTPADIDDILASGNKTHKILILGYKQFGNGLHFYNEEVEKNKYEWYVKIATYLKKKNLVISFDNLALDQLNVKRFISDETWEQFYQGEDGIFTMYIDAVNQQFAKSSTSSNRVNFSDMNLKQFFHSMKNND